MGALSAQLDEQRHALGVAGGNRIDDRLVGGRLIVYREPDGDIARVVVAEVGDLHLKSQRLINRRQPAGQPQIADTEVVIFPVIDDDQVQMNVALVGGQQLDGLVQFLPAADLAVGE